MGAQRINEGTQRALKTFFPRVLADGGVSQVVVKPARVLESAFSMECEVRDIWLIISNVLG